MITATIEQEIEALKEVIPFLEKKLKNESWNWEMIEQITFAERIRILKSTLSRLQKLNLKPEQARLF